MPTVTVQFDQYKIDNLKKYLMGMNAKGHPVDYEIYVDALKVVPRTADPSLFDDYDQYVSDDTEKIRILIYNGGNTNKNDQHCFIMKNASRYNGLGEIDTIIQEKLQARDREYEMKLLQRELDDTKDKLKDSEEYADLLSRQLEEEKSRKFLKTTSLADFSAAILEGMIRQNPQWLSRFPGVGNALAGFIEQDTIEKYKQPPALPETTVSFQRKENNDVVVSPEQLQYLSLLQSLEASFEQVQLDIIMQIIGRFAQEPATLQTVADLLNIKN